MKKLILLNVIGLVVQLLFNSNIKAQENTALNFDGVNDMVSFPAVATTATTATIECWFKITNIASIATGGHCLVYNGTSTADGYGIYFTNGKISVLFGNTYSFTSTYTIIQNQLYFCRLVVTAPNTATIDIGDNTIGFTHFSFTVPNSSVIHTPTGNLHFGNPGEYFAGTLDEVRIWNIARTNNVMDDNMCMLPSATAHLIHYYDFADGTANVANTGHTTLYDKNTNTFLLNGTLINFSLAAGTTSNYTTGQTVVQTTRFYVNQAATGLNNGSTWENAFNSLDSALRYIAMSGNCGTPEIWVAKGTYYPSKDFTGNTNPTDNRSKLFNLTWKVDSLKIYGGFAGGETSIDQRTAGNATILDGDLGVLGDNSDNAYHVLIANAVVFNPAVEASLVLDGLVITNGNANSNTYFSNFSNDQGAGFSTGSNKSVDLNFKNVIFDNNWAIYAAAVSAFTSHEEYLQCIFLNNRSDANCLFDITNGYGYGHTFINSIFVNNIVPYSYAIFGLYGSAPLNIENSIIYGNTANNDFVGYYNSSLNLNVQNSIIEDTSIHGTGVAYSNPHFADMLNPKGPDGKWMTNDDGLRIIGCAGIDKGNNTFSYTTNTLSKDLSFESRYADVNYVKDGGSGTAPIIDMGAYESRATADTSTFHGTLSNAHVVPYPPQRMFDSIQTMHTTFPIGADVKYSWIQSPDGINNWVPAAPVGTDTIYLIPSIQTSTSYRRNTNVCGVDFLSTNIIKIDVVPRNGAISGQVTSRGSGSGVDSVLIYVQKNIDLPGSPITYIDSAYTHDGGIYTVDNIFWGDSYAAQGISTSFKITPYKYNHKFNPSTTNRNLTTNVHQLTGINFQDTSSFDISGKVYQQCDSCLDGNGNITSIIAPVDSVEIRTVNTITSSNQITRTTYLNTPPDAPGYGRFSQSVTDQGPFIVTPNFNQHKFIPDFYNTGLVLNDVAGKHFRDTTTHVISGVFEAAYHDKIGTAILEFTDVNSNAADGSPRQYFRRRVSTNSDGSFSVRLPARKYKVSVIAFTPAYASNVPAYVDSFTIKNFFNVNMATRYPDSLIRNITTADTILNLIYHRPPVIVLQALDNVCNDAGYPFAVMQQSIPQTFFVKLYEGPESLGARLNPINLTTNDSLKLITNVHVDDINATLYYTLDSVGVATVTLTPGIPNIDSTLHFLKFMQIVYKDNFGRSVSMDKNIVVTGVKSDAGTFATVSPQVPLLILHDPPGDESSSYWESSRTFETAMHFYAGKTNSTELWENVKIGTEFDAGIGYEIPTSIWGSVQGGLNITSKINTSEESIVTSTTTSRFSTSGNNNIVGAKGDVYIGAALNLKYAAATEIKYNGGCNVTKTRRLIISENGFATTYIYTEDFILNNEIPRIIQLAQNPGNDSAHIANYMNQVKVWRQVVANNAHNKQIARFDKNISFNGGPTISNSTTATSTKSSTVDFNLEIDQSLAFELGFEMAGSGVSGGTNINFKMETGNSKTNTVTQSLTTGYDIHDNDPGDYFSVDIKKDPVYNTPVFEVIAGASSCPHEDNTQARDEMTLNIPHPSISGIDPARDTTFLLYVGNLSPSTEARQYFIKFNQSSNPNGAIVTIGGVPAIGLIDLGYIAYGASTQVSVTVKKCSSCSIYSYEGLSFTVSDACNDGITKTGTISAFFTSPCSNIILNSPQNNWLSTSANNNTLPIEFTGYSVPNLTNVVVQYAASGSSSWTDALTLLASDLNSSTTKVVYWNTQNLQDGMYNVRLKLTCLSGTIYSERVTGMIDRRAPQLYGKTDPTDDIYSIGDIIGISYDENINNSNLNNNKVTMTRINTGDTIPVQVSGYQNKVNIVPFVNLIGYNGEIIKVVVKNITDLYGNVKSMPDIFYFSVGSAVQTGNSNVVNLQIINPTLLENSGDSIQLKFNLGANAPQNIRVNYSVSGNGIYMQDYNVSYPANTQTLATAFNGAQGSIVILQGASSTTLKIKPIGNTYYEPNKTVAINLTQGGDYIMGNTTTATGTIVNDDVSTLYTFIGNGNFNVPGNWMNGTVPPLVLQTGDQILINPAGNGVCTLNVPLTINHGATFTVATGKKLVILGNVKIINY